MTTLEAELEGELEPGPTDELDCGQPGCEYRGIDKRAIGYHRWQTHQIRSSNPRPKRKPKGDPRPGVTVNASVLPPQVRRTGKRDDELDALQKRAEWFLKGVAMLVVLAGQEDDALDLQAKAELFSRAVRDVGEHEAWLRKMAAGGEQSERMLAWFQLVMVSGAIALPILRRHDALPKGIANLFDNLPNVTPGEPIAADATPETAAA